MYIETITRIRQRKWSVHSVNLSVIVIDLLQPTVVYLLCSAVSKALATGIKYPQQVVRSRLQDQHARQAFILDDLSHKNALLAQIQWCDGRREAYVAARRRARLLQRPRRVIAERYTGDDDYVPRLRTRQSRHA